MHIERVERRRSKFFGHVFTLSGLKLKFAARLHFGQFFRANGKSFSICLTVNELCQRVKPLAVCLRACVCVCERWRGL